MSALSLRRDLISKPIFRWAQQVLPTLSDTEREAIEAGDVWWDADLFSGNPAISKEPSHRRTLVTPSLAESWTK